MVLEKLKLVPHEPGCYLMKNKDNVIKDIAIILTYIKDIEYNNASEFLTSLSYGGELYKVFGKNFIFRGQSDHNYKLLPSALRGNLCKEWHKSCKEESLKSISSNSEYLQIEAEVEILSYFFNTCDMNKLHVPLTDRLRESVLLQIDPWGLFQKEDWLPKDYYETIQKILNNESYHK